MLCRKDQLIQLLRTGECDCVGSLLACPSRRDVACREQELNTLENAARNIARAFLMGRHLSRRAATVGHVERMHPSCCPSPLSASKVATTEDLFTRDAGQGESNTRHRIIKTDWL